jgi:hypothetical protein
LARDPVQRIKAWSPAESGQPPIIRPVYKRAEIVRQDGAKIVQVTTDQLDQVGIIIQRERKRAGLDPLDDQTLADEVAKVRGNVQRTENPDVLYSLQIDEIRFHRGLTKIA